jgi:N12 class adenine-specific DNA methylase
MTIDSPSGTVFSIDAPLQFGSAAQRYAQNLAALRLLRQLEAEHREIGDLTPDEQRTLAHYSAFGDSSLLSRVFPSQHQYRAQGEIAELLSDDEQASVKRTALTAFYTPIPIIQAIWDALMRAGLATLDPIRILEPSAGVGNFIAAMPMSIRSPADIFAIELDHMSGAMLRYLHPDVRVYTGVGFQDVSLPERFFDLAISNIPFGDFKVHDPQLPRQFLRRTIHDYFFAKALRIVRPGGIIAFLTSYGTLDKKDDRVRRWLVEQAELIAAVRLPNGVFRENAGSESATDLLILRTYRAGDTIKDAPWIASAAASLPTAPPDIGRSMTFGSRYADRQDADLIISQHFIDNPDQIVGTAYQVRNYNGVWLHVQPPEHTTIACGLAERLAALPEGGLWLPPIDDQVDDAPHATEGEARLTLDLAALPDGTAPRIAELLNVYHAAKQVIQLEIGGADLDTQAEARKALRSAYMWFVAQYGIINNPTNKRALKDAPELSFLLALETDIKRRNGLWVAKKARIFTEPTIRPAQRIFMGDLSPKEALIRCLDTHGRVDIPFIVRLSGTSEADVLAALDGVIYRVPATMCKQYVTADEYLSGNIREKLRAARAHAEVDSQYLRHVAALEAALPPPLSAGEITANLGAPWIPADVVETYIRTIIPAFRQGRVHYHSAIATWEVEDTNRASWSVEATTQWGTQRMDAIAIVQATLNGQLTVVYDVYTDVDGSEKRRINDAETLAAQEKQQQLREHFMTWVWEDASRSRLLVEIYNERFNSIRVRHYDGSHLTLPGINTTILRNGDLDPHQKDVVWQILQEQTALVGHAVGGGKTFSLIVAAREARRMGLINKPLVVVPSGLIAQWAAEVHRIYPGLKVLAMAPEDFEKRRRGTIMSRIAIEDWDMIIIGHTSFKFLPVGRAAIEEFMERECVKLHDYLEDLKSDEDVSRRTLKDIERQILRLETRLLDMLGSIKRDSERTITWEELGIDMLMIDEAHEFKNLAVPTRMGRIAGAPNGDSQRAFDMRLKTWDLIRRGGKVIFATGTPVLNTLGEVYVMMLYLQERELEAEGINHFDSWARTFAQTQMAFEMKPDGSGFRMNTRLCRFVNLPELATLWRTVLNVRTAEQMNLPRPKLASGRPIPVVVAANTRLKQFVASLAARVDRIKKGQVSPAIDNMLKITSEGRLAALDLRLVLGGEEEPRCKINALVENVVEVHARTTRRRGTQLIFCDLATPKGRAEKGDRRSTDADTPAAARAPEPEVEAEQHDGGDEAELPPTEMVTAQEYVQITSVYHEIRDKLIARGVPAEEIAFIHDFGTRARREALFAAMRAGQIRVLLGSTLKMGAGMNVQDRLIALHHLDAPWRPGDIEQREGRILRQGNGWDEVFIYVYIQEGSFDGFLWQLLESKARFISQVMAGEVTARTADDVSDVVLNAADIKALASGNPKVIHKVKLDAELARLERIRAVWISSMVSLRQEQQHIGSDIDRARQRAAFLEEAQIVYQAHADAPFSASLVRKIGDIDTAQDYTKREDAGTMVRKLIDRIKLAALQQRSRVTATIGTYRGFSLRVHALPHPDADAPLTLHFTSPGHGEHAISAYEVAARTDAGVFASADATLRRLSDDIRAARARVSELERRRESIDAQLEQPWDQAARYRRTVEDLNRVNAELVKDGTIDAEEAAPIELIEGEIETWASPDHDPTEILAYSNAIPLPAAEQEFDSIGLARADTAAEALPSAHTAGPPTNGTAHDSTMLWDAVFQPVQPGANGTNTNGKRGQADNRQNGAAPHQLSLFDL